MPPQLTVCRCDPQWLAIAACETCLARAELARLHRVLVAEGMVRASSLAIPGVLPGTGEGAS